MKLINIEFFGYRLVDSSIYKDYFLCLIRLLLFFYVQCTRTHIKMF